MKKLLLLCTLALTMLLLSTRIKAQFNPQPDPPAFGLVSISYFETLQLNSYCAVNDVPPGPCSVQLQFSDAAGHVLHSSAATLQPGQSASLSLHGTDLMRAPGKVMVLPAVQIGGPGGVVSTLESAEEVNLAGLVHEVHTNYVLHPTALFHGSTPQ